ncbi:MAG: HEAT repeat domain-containing protein, partial [Pirellulales bacterium]
LPLIDDSDPTFRPALVQALGGFQEKEATEAIVALSRKDVSARYAAIYALQGQDTAPAASPLGELLQDDDVSIQRRARSALGRMRTPEAEKILEQAGG